MKIKQLLFPVLIGSTMLVGCQKDPSLKAEQKEKELELTSNVKVSGSRLAFKSLDDFDKTLSLMEDYPDEIKVKLKKNGFYKN